MFSYYERLLAVVPRWSIAPRLNPQSVAEHSHYVTLYTSRLAMLMAWEPEKRLLAVDFAMRHDRVEAQTGDTPGPIKRQIVDKAKLAAFQQRFDQITKEPFRFERVTPDIMAVVKAADLIDELFWISMEVLMGNRLIEPQRAKVINRLSHALGNIGQTPLFVELLNECANMARGIDFPENNEDLNGYGSASIP